MTNGTKAAFECTSQQDHRRRFFAEQRVSAGAVVDREAIVGLQLQNSLECRVRFFPAAKTSVGFGQTAHHDDVVETGLEFSRGDLENFQRRLVSRLDVSKLSLHAR